MKPRLHQRLHVHRYDRLRDPVRDRRHAQETNPPAVRLRDLDRPDRRWKPGPRTHPVGSPGGIAPPGSHRSRRDSLPSPGSSHPVIQAMVVHCQWLSRVGSRFTTPVHHAMARLNARSRLYFLRAHRRM